MDSLSLTQVEDLSGSLAQRVYQSLLEAILNMKFPPGTILRKGKICSHLNVSRSPVTEAIARLSADKLVEVIPQSATRVARLSMSEIREACFLREALELAVVDKIARTRTDEQLIELTRNVRLHQLLVEDNDFEGFYKVDEEFHSLLMDSTGFPGISSFADSINLRLTRARMLLLPAEGRPLEAAKEHAQIVEAIREQDPEAARRHMKYHLSQLINSIEPLEKTHPEYFKSR
jgi:GntR family transcriptional regulator, rspAB operon transcriptional repressor